MEFSSDDPDAGRAARMPVSACGPRTADSGRPTAARSPDGTLTVERTALIRQRLRSGAYHSADLAREVARRMLDAGAV